MPTYTYRCKICQMVHSHVHGMSDNPLPPCPMCGGFSERVAGGAPAVLNQTPAPKSEKPEKSAEEKAHVCTNMCVLQRRHVKN